MKPDMMPAKHRAMEVDLGTPSAHVVTAAEVKKGDGKSYPRVTIRDQALERFEKAYGPCQMGDMMEMPMKCRVVGMHKDKNGCSMEMEMMAVTGDTVEEDKPKRNGQH